ncbi:MAG: hypothetical protein KF861_01630 [Planctomycetaceae bacterium]|nr:hypothetical protein [Planctomycetaceae bacterium]
MFGIQKGRRRKLVSALLLVVALIPIVKIWWTGAPSRQVVLSLESTFFTEPVLPDGKIDYVAAIHNQLREGVTKENNAVAIWMQLHATEHFDGPDGDEFHRELGIDRPAKAETEFDFFLPHLVESKDIHQPEPAMPREQAEEQLLAVRTRPWTADEFPEIADAVASMQGQIELLLKGVERSHAYQPPVFHFLDKRNLMSKLLLLGNTARESGYQFATAAMLHLANGDEDLAWRYCLAGHRLARHLARLGSLIECKIAFEVEGIATQATRAYIQHASDESAKTRLQEFVALGPISNPATTLRLTDRCIMLEMLQSIRYGESIGTEENGLGIFVRLLNVKLDWDSILRQTNQLVDEAAEAFEEPDYQHSMERLEQFLTKLNKIHEAADPIMYSQYDKNENMLGIAVSVFPAINDIRTMQAITQQQADFLQILLALKAYRSETGQLPDSLDALVPRFLESVPQDRFGDQPLQVLVSQEDVELRSLGPDGVDDDGVPYSPEEETGDLTMSLSVN